MNQCNDKTRYVKCRSLLNVALMLSFSFLLSGCGFGWLYMRIGDSNRIKGMKILAYDKTQKRFRRARSHYKSALQYYEDSILYDELGNPEVYYKAGETCLLLNPPNLRTAASFFKDGLKAMRKIFDKKGVTSVGKVEKTSSGIEYVIVKDRDYAQLHAGMGLVNYLKGVATQNNARFGKAIEYLEIADQSAPPSRVSESGFISQIMDWFNLRELVTPTPIPVIMAKVLNYRGKLAQKKGMDSLADSYFSQAKEYLDRVKRRHPKDTRLLAEYTRLYYLSGDMEKCTQYLDEIINTKIYADKVNYMLLKGEVLNKTGQHDQAIKIFTDILDIDPENVRALIGRSMGYAKKGELGAALADLENFLSLDTEDPQLFLAAGKIYNTLKQFSSAEQMFLKAYYKESKDIEINYLLGKLYTRMGKKEQAKTAFERVINLGPTSSFADHARSEIKSY